MEKKKRGNTKRNILIAFLLNLTFSVFEFFGGFFTGSVAILSDSVHDLGDAVSIGLSWFLERKSEGKADNVYTYGYRRYSVLGGLITTVILLVGSILVIISSVKRLVHPVEINYDGMIIFAVAGVTLNFLAAWFTREGDSINQKAVNLHMLEDVLGWAVVLVGAVIMRFTGIGIIDPVMSIGVSLFIAYNACKGLKEVLDLFLEKVPEDIDVEKLTEHILEIEGVKDVHHIHVWSIDGTSHCATMHAVVTSPDVRNAIKEELREHGIGHTIIETESEDDECSEKECTVESSEEGHGGHHHHHHH